MILTGRQIEQEIDLGSIEIAPFSKEQVNPNSYNYRLGETLLVANGNDPSGKPRFKKIALTSSGYVLNPRQMYLAHTQEIIGSKKYAMSLIGRSSIGRLGLFLQASANLGHVTSQHQWTLELVAALPIRIYPRMIIGQVSFWENYGEILEYTGRHGRLNGAQESKLGEV